MRPSALLHPLVSLLALPLCTVAASPSTSHSISIHIWPLSSVASSPYLDITYQLPDSTSTLPSADSSPSSASTSSQRAAPAIPSSDRFVRLGFYRADLSSLLGGKTDDSWVGISVPPSALDARANKTISLLLDRQGSAWHLGLESTGPPPTSAARKRKAGEEEQEGATTAAGEVGVRLVERAAGPRPVLNKPVVLTADGKVEGAAGEGQSFLQKYWWAIALFLLLQVVMTGAAGDEKK